MAVLPVKRGKRPKRSDLSCLLYKGDLLLHSSLLSPFQRRSPLLEAETPNQVDLLTHPPKLLDLLGIEGEATDLQLHQAVLHFPLIHLRALWLGFPWEP